MIDAAKLTQKEREVLLYAEVCLVDHGGLMEGFKLRKGDEDILEKLQAAEFLKFGRISKRQADEIPTSRSVTHWVEFSEAAWKCAHELRRMSADGNVSYGSRIARG